MFASIRVAKMLRFCSCSRKNSTNVVELVADESRQTPGSQKSVSVPETPAANNKGEGTPWRYRLFGRLALQVTTKKKPVVTSENHRNIKPWWRRLKKTNKVAPIIDENEVVKFKALTEEEERALGLDDEVHPTKTIRQQHSKCVGGAIVDEKKVVKSKGLTEKEDRSRQLDNKVLKPENKTKEAVPPRVPPPVPQRRPRNAVPPTKTIRQQKIEHVGGKTIDENKVVKVKGLTEEEEISRRLENTVLQTVPEKKTKEAVPPRVPPPVPPRKARDAVPPTKTIRQQQIKCAGFPNPAQFCYMNSCLQSLLTLTDFTGSISRQEQIWSCVPEAALMRSFMDIEASHFSGDFRRKIRLLCQFKKAILSPEFLDNDQKDAHEFLVCVLDEMRSCSSRLQTMAAFMGGSYSCPVQEHMVFKMLNTRTCKRCGKGSTSEEEFSNLSLDLIPGGGNVEQMLEDYQKERELEYRCDCGATKSVQRSSFLTMPKVLLLHLKRFRFTPSYQLEKVHQPVDLQRELVLTSNQDGYCYSLVSTINHYGSTLESGHYICDGADPDAGQEDPTDRWFTYNDHEVNETSGDRVCDQRKETAYILFYKRQD